MMKRSTIGLTIMVCVILFTFVNQCEAASVTMTKSEKRVYSRWMLSGIRQTEYGPYYQSKKQGVMYDPKFYVYDINGDGHKDIIVTGSLGLRIKTYSEIYMHVNGKYKVIPVRGTVKGVSSRGIYSVEDDHIGAGQVYYHSLMLYRFDKHGRIAKQYEDCEIKMFYDRDKNIRYKNGKVISRTRKTASGKKISAGEFNKLKSQINRRNIDGKMYSLTRVNIRKYLK